MVTFLSFLKMTCVIFFIILNQLFSNVADTYKHLLPVKSLLFWQPYNVCVYLVARPSHLEICGNRSIFSNLGIHPQKIHRVLDYLSRVFDYKVLALRNSF